MQSLASTTVCKRMCDACLWWTQCGRWQQQQQQQQQSNSPTMTTMPTATQMAMPSTHSPFNRCSSSAAPSTVDTDSIQALGCSKEDFSAHRPLLSQHGTVVCWHDAMPC
jgi:hypothetical protein